MRNISSITPCLLMGLFVACSSTLASALEQVASQAVVEQQHQPHQQTPQRPIRRRAIEDYNTSEDDFTQVRLPVPVVLTLYETSGFLSVQATNELAFGLSTYLLRTIQNELQTNEQIQREFELLLDGIPQVDRVFGVVLKNSNDVLPGQDGQDYVTGSRLEIAITVQWESQDDGDINSIDGSPDVAVATTSMFGSMVEQALRETMEDYEVISTRTTASSSSHQQHLLSNLTLSNLEELQKITSAIYYPPTSIPTLSPIASQVIAPTAAPVAQEPTATIVGANRDVASLQGDDERAAQLWPALIVAAAAFILTALWIAFGRRKGVDFDDLASLPHNHSCDDEHTKEQKQQQQHQQRAHSFVLRNAVGAEPQPLPYSSDAAAAASSSTFNEHSRGHTTLSSIAETTESPDDSLAVLPSIAEMTTMPDGTHIHHSHPKQRYGQGAALPANAVAAGYRTEPMPLEEASDIDSEATPSCGPGTHRESDEDLRYRIAPSRSDSNRKSSARTGMTPSQWQHHWHNMSNRVDNRGGFTDDTRMVSDIPALGDDISNYSGSGTTASSADRLMAPSHNGTGLFCTTNLLGEVNTSLNSSAYSSGANPASRYA